MGTNNEEAQEVTRITLDTLAERGTTAYMTSHMHEIADEIKTNRYQNTINLGSEIIYKNGKPTPTHRIIRGRNEQSYGYLIREKLGFSEEKYRKITEQMKIG